jgi:GrpB-like predicted nucleotidyltransferase (UPF0157 family)
MTKYKAQINPRQEMKEKTIAKGTTAHVTAKNVSIGEQPVSMMYETVIRYHWTDILTVYASDLTNDVYVQICTNGWRTATTKRRINDMLRMMGVKAYIYQQRGDWYLVYTDSDGKNHEERFFEASGDIIVQSIRL